MDTLRGQFDSLADSGGHDASDDEIGSREAPPPSIGQDERRMQVRAYNHWASLLKDRNYPAIEDLEPDNLPDFGPFGVLLDFTNGIENPGIAYLGPELAAECGEPVGEMATLADVPSRSLLSRITDHYMQILANQAPIGFEAEFVNQRGRTILYRGILLPFSTDDDTIDFIYGVINWKELADQQAADELLLEIDQALEPKPTPVAAHEPLTDWADGPGAVPANDQSYPSNDDPASDDLPRPSFGLDDDEAYQPADEPFDLEEEMVELHGETGDVFEPAGEAGPDEYETGEAFDENGDEDEEEDDGAFASLLPAELEIPGASLRKKPIVIDETAEAPLEDPFAPLEFASGFEENGFVDSGFELAATDIDIAPEDMGLGDWLAAAREMAATACTSEDRTRQALYEAIGRAYDFSLAASQVPEEFDELLTDAGLTYQDRAPMTPVVKLVFGADYDKTRLTEYAAALTHAHRLELPQGSLGTYLAQAEGGLKGVVKAERRLRREETGEPVEAPDAPRHALAKKLRALPAQDFAAIGAEGAEFALVMVRRTDEGVVEVLGEVPDDVALVEKAARRLLA
jgi:hypothetical protein